MQPEFIERIGEINLPRGRQIKIKGHLITLHPVKSCGATGYEQH
jgi:hypothetical protein